MKDMNYLECLFRVRLVRIMSPNAMMVLMILCMFSYIYFIQAPYSRHEGLNRANPDFCMYANNYTRSIGCVVPGCTYYIENDTCQRRIITQLGYTSSILTNGISFFDVNLHYVSHDYTPGDASCNPISGVDNNNSDLYNYENASGLCGVVADYYLILYVRFLQKPRCRGSAGENRTSLAASDRPTYEGFLARMISRPDAVVDSTTSYPSRLSVVLPHAYTIRGSWDTSRSSAGLYEGCFVRPQVFVHCVLPIFKDCCVLTNTSLKIFIYTNVNYECNFRQINVRCAYDTFPECSNSVCRYAGDFKRVISNFWSNHVIMWPCDCHSKCLCTINPRCAAHHMSTLYYVNLMRWVCPPSGGLVDHYDISMRSPVSWLVASPPWWLFSSTHSMMAMNSEMCMYARGVIHCEFCVGNQFSEFPLIPLFFDDSISYGSLSEIGYSTPNTSVLLEYMETPMHACLCVYICITAHVLIAPHVHILQLYVLISGDWMSVYDHGIYILRRHIRSAKHLHTTHVSSHDKRNLVRYWCYIQSSSSGVIFVATNGNPDSISHTEVVRFDMQGSLHIHKWDLSYTLCYFTYVLTRATSVGHISSIRIPIFYVCFYDMLYVESKSSHSECKVIIYYTLRWQL